MTDNTTSGRPASGNEGNGSTLPRGLAASAEAVASGLMTQAKDAAAAQVTERQERAADSIGTVARALRKANEELRASNSVLASYTERAADEVDRFAQRLREKSPAEHMATVEDFARRHPTVFLVGALAAGVTLARVLTSASAGSSSSRSRSSRRSGEEASADSGKGERRWPESHRPWPESDQRSAGRSDMASREGGQA